MNGTSQNSRIRPRTARLIPEGPTVVVQRFATLAIDDAQLQRWVNAAMPDLLGEITVRLVEADESASLNRRYRDNDKPTNVLSFPCQPPPAPIEDDLLPLGDLVLCVPVIAAEAEEQGKALDAHWAHMLIHGCLHLRGFDHETTAEARAMEEKERNLMALLGFADPYGVL
jgi:probable rRNA maturation factor